MLTNKISQLWFIICVYHFADFVQKCNYYLNYPNQTIHFFLLTSIVEFLFLMGFRVTSDASVLVFYLLLVTQDLQVALWPLAVQMVFLLHITNLLTIPYLFLSLEGWHKAINNYWLDHHSYVGKYTVLRMLPQYAVSPCDLSAAVVRIVGLNLNGFLGTPRVSVYRLTWARSCVILLVSAVCFQGFTAWTHRVFPASGYPAASTCNWTG